MITENETDRLEETGDAYASLARVLNMAYAQAATGKGEARHNQHSRPFTRQPILEISRMVGIGYPTGQAMKKAQEAVGMFNRAEYDKAEAEFLGAINYLAAAYMLTTETKIHTSQPEVK